MIMIRKWVTYSGEAAQALPLATPDTTRVYVAVAYNGQVMGSVYTGIKMLTSKRSQFTAHAYTRDNRILVHNFLTLKEAKAYVQEAIQC